MLTSRRILKDLTLNKLKVRLVYSNTATVVERIIATDPLAMATIYGKSDQSPATIRVTAMQRWHAVLWTLGQRYEINALNEPAEDGRADR